MLPGLALLVAVAVLMGGLGAASAGGLVLAGQAPTAVVATHPCPGTASLTATNRGGSTAYRNVVVTVPSGCEGRQVQLYLDRTGTSGDRWGGGATNDLGVASLRMSQDVSTNASYVASATVDGWSLPVTWNGSLAPHIWCSVLDDTAATCEATVTLFRGTKPGGGEFDYYDVVVTTTSTTYVTWEVGMKLDHAFYGPVPNTLGNSTLDGYWDGATSWTGDRADVNRVSTCNQYPGIVLLTGVGTTGNNPFADVRADRVRSFSLVLNYQQGTYDDLVTAACSP